MASELERVITQFYDDLADGEDKATRLLEAGYTRTLEAYDREAAKVLRLIESDGESASRAFQYQRLQALASQAADEVSLFGDTVVSATTDVQGVAGDIARNASLQMIDATGRALGFASYATMPGGAISRMVGSLADGSPLRSLTTKYAGQSAREMNRLLLEGVALGRSPNETARLMRDRLNVPYSNARTLVRTEQLRVFRETNRGTMVANRNVVKRWKWYAVLDRLSCPVCFAMHGQEFPLTERMETHPNCRCVQLPVTATFRELGFQGINEPQGTGYAAQSRAGARSDGGRFTAADTLNQRGIVLFDQLSVPDKEFILGKTGWKAYDSGLVRLSDFVQPTNSREWGRGRTTKPLASILSRDTIRGLQGRGQGGPVAPRTIPTPKPVVRSVPRTPTKPSRATVAPPVTKPPAPVAPSAWSPVMKRSQAQLWANQGDLKRPLFHVTGEDGERGIKASGFDLSRKAWGRVWGNGAYMSDTRESYEMYKTSFANPKKLELRVFSRKTYVKDISGRSDWGHTEYLEDLPNGQQIYRAYTDKFVKDAQDWEDDFYRRFGSYPSYSTVTPSPSDTMRMKIWQQNWQREREQAKRDGIIVDDASAEAFTRTLRDDFGFDAIEIIDNPHRSSVGGSQVIVFDPKRVVVVEDD